MLLIYHQTNLKNQSLRITVEIINTEEKINKAVNNDQLKALLLGKCEYKVPFRCVLGPMVPTDWTQVFVMTK